MCDRSSVYCHVLKMCYIWLQIVAFDRYQAPQRTDLSKTRRTTRGTRGATGYGQRNQARDNQKALHVPGCAITRPQQFQLVHAFLHSMICSSTTGWVSDSP